MEGQASRLLAGYRTGLTGQTAANRKKIYCCGESGRAGFRTGRIGAFDAVFRRADQRHPGLRTTL